jgi:hypothetical protein
MLSRISFFLQKVSIQWYGRSSRYIGIFASKEEAMLASAVARDVLDAVGVGVSNTTAEEVIKGKVRVAKYVALSVVSQLSLSRVEEEGRNVGGVVGSDSVSPIWEEIKGLEGKRNLNVSGDDSTEMGEDKKRSTPEDHTREEVDFSLNDSIDGKPVDKRPDVGLYKADSGKWVSRTFACLILKVT